MNPADFERMLVQPRGGLELADQIAGELQRERLGLALGQIDQDIGDVVGLGGQIDAGDHVGLVFDFGEPGRLGVGSAAGQSVDRGAFGLPLAARDRNRRGSR